MSALLTYILDHAWKWLLMLFVFFTFDQLFRNFVPDSFLHDISELIIYGQNLYLFKFFPEEAIVFAFNVMIMFFSIDLLLILMDHKRHSKEKK